MTLNDAYLDWDGLTDQRKKEIVDNIFKYFKDNPEDGGVLVDYLCDLENDDFFGTQGLEV